MTSVSVRSAPPIGVTIKHAPLSVAAPASALALGVSERGEQGPKGDTGARGPGGAGTTSSFAFAQPTMIWTINHDLGRYPSVTTVDTADDQIIGDLVYISDTSLQITFSAPTAGTAFLN